MPEALPATPPSSPPLPSSVRWREGAAAAAALVVIYAVAVLARERYMTSIAGDALPRYWMESAQHAWYTEQIARNGALPRFDPRLGWPDGLDTRTDTLVPMYVGGLLYRHVMSRWMAFPEWLLWYTRLSASLIVVACYVVAREAFGSRSGALLAAAWSGWSVLGIASSSGHSVYHEHLGLPLFGLFLGAFLVHLRTRRPLALAAAAVFLVLGLQSWIVLSLYYGVFVAAVGALLLAAGDDVARTAWRGLLLMTLAVAVLALAWDGYLRRTGFAWSSPMLLAYAVLALPPLKRRGVPSPLLALIGLTLVLGVNALVPSSPELSHVGSLLAAKLRYWDKPEDPSLLSFDPRHLWGGDFDSPGAFRALSVLLLLGLASVPAAVGLAVRLRRRTSLPGELFVATMALPSLAGYVLLAKVQPFLSLLVTPLVAGSFAASRARGARVLLWTACLFELFRSVTGGVSALETGLRGLGLRNVAHAETVSHSGRHLAELLQWIGSCTAPGEAFYAEYTISPSILLYADRPIVLHTFFQSDVPAKYEEQARALFGTEEALLAVLRKYRATYLLFAPGMLLRSDRWASYRYLDGDLDLDPASVAYKLNFRPQELAGLALAYESPVFRVFRLRELGAAPPAPGCAVAPARYPLFDEGAFLAHRPDAEENVRAQSFHSSRIRAYLLLDRALALLASGDTSEVAGVVELARQAGPDVPEAALLSARLAEARGDLPAAAALYRQAAELAPDDAGTHLLEGRCRRALGQLAQAEVSLRRAVELAPRGPALVDLGTLLAEGGRCHELADLGREASLPPSLEALVAACEPASAPIQGPTITPPAPREPADTAP